MIANCRLPIADFEMKAIGSNWKLAIGNWQ
jgi:hypothetical protein